MQVFLDAEKLRTKEAAHKYLKEELNLPDYYGYNLDALFDCLTEQDNLEVIFQNVPFEDPCTYFNRISRVFTEAALENPGLWIKSVLDEDL